MQLLTSDLCACYGYNADLIELFLSLFSPAEAPGRNLTLTATPTLPLPLPLPLLLPRCNLQWAGLNQIPASDWQLRANELLLQLLPRHSPYPYPQPLPLPLPLLLTLTLQLLPRHARA